MKWIAQCSDRLVGHLLIAIALLAGTVAPSHAGSEDPPVPKKYTNISYDGLWRADAPPAEMVSASSLAAFVAFGNTMPPDYQLIDFEIDVREGEEELLGVWSQVGEVSAHQLHLDLTPAAFAATRAMLTGQFQLMDLEIYERDQQRRFAGVWQPSPDDEIVEVDLAWLQLLLANSSHEAAGYYLVDVEVYAIPSGWRYAGLWHPGNGQVHLERMFDSEDFLATAVSLAQDQDWRLIDVERRWEEGESVFVGLWHEDAEYDWLTMSVRWKTIDTNNDYLELGFPPPHLPQVSIVPRNLMDIEILSFVTDGSIAQNAIHDEPTTGPPDI